MYRPTPLRAREGESSRPGGCGKPAGKDVWPALRDLGALMPKPATRKVRSMKIAVLFSVIFAGVGIASAALPPQYQNMKDLDVIVEYIREHPEVAAGLRSIDLGALTVYYGHHCKAVFGRKAIAKPPGWVGPADPLELKSSGCSDD